MSKVYKFGGIKEIDDFLRIDTSKNPSLSLVASTRRAAFRVSPGPELLERLEKGEPISLEESMERDSDEYYRKMKALWGLSFFHRARFDSESGMWYFVPPEKRNKILMDEIVEKILKPKGIEIPEIKIVSEKIFKGFWFSVDALNTIESLNCKRVMEIICALTLFGAIEFTGRAWHLTGSGIYMCARWGKGEFYYGKNISHCSLY